MGQWENGITEYSGTYSYLDTGGEQTVLELSTNLPKVLQGIWLDLTTMTQNGTIQCYYKIDGTNYRLFKTTTFTVATDPDGVFIPVSGGILKDFKVTYTEGANEGAARAVPYAIIYEV